MRLGGKKAIVTGAAQGLGAAIVERLAVEGCDVACFDVNLDVVRQTAERVAARTGRKITAAKVDVSDAQAVREAVAAAAEDLGGLDIFVSNAGILISGELTYQKS